MTPEELLEDFREDAETAAEQVEDDPFDDIFRIFHKR